VSFDVSKIYFHRNIHQLNILSSFVYNFRIAIDVKRRAPMGGSVTNYGAEIFESFTVMLAIVTMYAKECR